MNFFKDLKDEMEGGEDFSTDEKLLDGFEDFELSDDDALGIEEELLAKMQLEEELFGEEEEVTSVPVIDEIEETKAEETKEEVKAEEEVSIPVEEETLPVEEPVAEPDKVTVISKGTVINGSIISDGSLEVLGTVNGDINCLGKLTISGAVKGKSNASEVFINAKRVDGGITCQGSIKVSAGTVIIGDVKATSCVVAGAVKGDIDVNGPVVIDSTAVVKGNISSSGIQINSGAVIDGFCAQPYSTVNIDSFFEDEVEA